MRCIYGGVPISKLLNLATAFLIFTTVTKHTEATDLQCHGGTAPQSSTVHMTADVSHVQLVEIFHKSFVLLLTSTYRLQLLLCLIAVCKTLGTAATLLLFAHITRARVFGLFLHNHCMDPLHSLIKSEPFHYVQVLVTRTSRISC
jgi:hypothetical protein